MDVFENSLKLVKVYGFDEMKIKSRFFGAPKIFIRAKAGERDRLDWARSTSL